MEDVGGRRVVHDGHPAQVPPEPLQVFDVVASVEDAGLAEQTGPEHAPLVQKVGHRVSVLRGRSGHYLSLGHYGSLDGSDQNLLSTGKASRPIRQSKEVLERNQIGVKSPVSPIIGLMKILETRIAGRPHMRHDISGYCAAGFQV